MSGIVVVDSSVAVKWFCSHAEEGCEGAQAILARHRDEPMLAAPTLLRLEVLNAFWKRRADADDLAAIGRALDSFALEWFEITADLAEASGSIAATHRLTTYDAVFVALARQLDAELVTEDAKIVRSGACRIRQLA